MGGKVTQTFKGNRLFHESFSVMGRRIEENSCIRGYYKQRRALARQINLNIPLASAKT